MFKRPASGLLAVTLVAFLVAGTLVFLGLFFLWPSFTLIGMGLFAEGELDLSAFQTLLTQSHTWSVIWRTIWMALAGTVGSVICGLPLAFVLYKLRFPGRTIARGLIAVPFVLPTVAVAAGYQTLFTRGGWLEFLHLEHTETAIIIAMIFFNTALIARSVGSLWARLDPRLEQAARTLGATPSRTFRTVTLPALRPAILSAASLVFLYCSTAYSLVMVLGGIGVSTIETEIYYETTQYLNLRGAAVLSIVQILIVALALLLAFRSSRKAETSLRFNATVVDRPLRASDAPVTIASILIVLVVIALPLVNVVIRSLRRGGEWTLANYTDMADPQAAKVLQTSVLESLWLTLKTGAVAALIAVLVGLIVVVIASRPVRSPKVRTLQSTYDALFMLPLGVSAVTVGFGFLVTLDAPPLNLGQSDLMVPLAQAIVAIPLVVRVTAPTIRGINDRLRQAAATLGASPLRVLVTVDGPMILRAALVAAGFAMAVCMGEFGATSFLIRPQSPTLPIVIYQLVSRPGATEQGMAMAACMLLCVSAAAIMVAVEKLRPQSLGGF
ncbi:iron ABC transporter permease [Boudabousia marimammalium]|uniref:Iron ABC transporter permease n=1 Tax=Boudabousia marimammalium TaxID=156892 RepID=A0A1Q5PM46_9ACTO|nr:iron ABC transporter permease [Boudabousia marimammalium]